MPTPAATNDPFPAFMGRLYALWSLDCLNDIGYAISVDFIARPQLYLGDDIPDAILQLRTSYGMNGDFPNMAQRQAMMLPIFGRSDWLKPDPSANTAPFYTARRKFFDAVGMFAERAVENGVSMLEERVRSAAITFRANLQGLTNGSDAVIGKSIRLTGSQLESISRVVTSILVAPGVAKVFGVSAANPKWPLDSNDPNGAKLVEIAGSTLQLTPECKIGYTKFIHVQRAAQEGARALPLVLTTNLNDEGELLNLITQAYTWGTSLRDFQQMV